MPRLHGCGICVPSSLYVPCCVDSRSSQIVSILISYSYSKSPNMKSGQNQKKKKRKKKLILSLCRVPNAPKASTLCCYVGNSLKAGKADICTRRWAAETPGARWLSTAPAMLSSRSHGHTHPGTAGPGSWGQKQAESYGFGLRRSKVSEIFQYEFIMIL